MLKPAVKALRDSMGGAPIGVDAGLGSGISLTIGRLKDGREIMAFFKSSPGDYETWNYVGIGVVNVGIIGSIMFHTPVSWDTTNTMANAIEHNVKLLRLKELKDGTLILEVAYKDDDKHKYEAFIRPKNRNLYRVELSLEAEIEDAYQDDLLPYILTVKNPKEYIYRVFGFTRQKGKPSNILYAFFIKFNYASNGGSYLLEQVEKGVVKEYDVDMLRP